MSNSFYLCLHQIFVCEAYKNSQKLAIELDEQSITYNELLFQTQQLSLYLIDKCGIKVGEIILQCVERSIEMCVGILSILTCGSIYFSLNPSDPNGRLQTLINDMENGRLLLLHTSTKNKLSGIQLNSIDLKHMLSEQTLIITDDDLHRLSIINVTYKHLFYIVSTSGTTGKPKYIQHQHKNLLLYTQAYQKLNIQNQNDIILQLAGSSWVLHVMEIIPTLITGGTLIMLKPQGNMNMKYLVETIEKKQVSMMTMASTTTRILCEYLQSDIHSMHQQCMMTVRILGIAGEPLKQKTICCLLSYMTTNSQIYSVYGSSECFSLMLHCVHELKTTTDIIPIGSPLPHFQCYLFDEQQEVTAVDQIGEIHVCGSGLFKGYLNNPIATEKAFIIKDGNKFFKTGDLAKYNANGEFIYIGRKDFQVKIYGQRIETQEIENRLLSVFPEITDCVIIKYSDNEDEYLIAYIQSSSIKTTLSLKTYCEKYFPSYMVPHAFIILEKFPLNPNGKLDRQQFPSPNFIKSQDELVNSKLLMQLKTNPDLKNLTRERLLFDVITAWNTVLPNNTPIEDVDVDVNFFEAGGNSSLGAKLLSCMAHYCQTHLTIVDLFKYPTISLLVQHLEQKLNLESSATKIKRNIKNSLDSFASEVHLSQNDIAIIGLAGRFPGADNIEEFWSNLINGKESLVEFNDPDLDHVNFNAQPIADSVYVPVNGWLGKNSSNDDHTRNIFGFDANFFGYSRHEAELIDPQQRLFLEVCYQALEDAGVVSDDLQDENKTVGVFGSIGWNAYLNKYVLPNQTHNSTVNTHRLMLNNDSHFLSTRVSFKLNLHGPSVVVQTACSSSLVAIHMAKEAIIRGECHIAIAGGVNLGELKERGYNYTSGHILSPDGHCRALDLSANGTVPAQGLGVVVLKSLAAAQQDHDQIYAVIIGSAINNDGSNKASYAAPNPLGQKEAIQKALLDCRRTEVKKSMYYIECHGTGTQLGDMIELTALCDVYSNEKTQHPIAIGSIKSNIGHVEIAAGVAGLIKTTLALHRKQLPPSINCEHPNKIIGENNQVFYVTTQLTNIPVLDLPIYASVSSFGMGGTNAHMVILQYQNESRSINVSSNLNYQVLCWTAKAPEAANKMRIQLLDTMKHHSEAQTTYYCNAAYTSQVGRIHYKQARQMIVAKDTLHAVKRLRECTSSAMSTLSILPAFIFIFPGQGVHYSGMGMNLYQHIPSFRALVDQIWFSCIECVQSSVSLYHPTTIETIRELSIGDIWTSCANIENKSSWLSQIGLFLLQYCLSMWLINMGVKMDACIGHSLGHYVTAVFSGILSVECAMLMLLKRSELLHLHINQETRGAMLSIKISHDTALEILPDDVEIAAINSSCHITVAGSDATIDALHEMLDSKNVPNTRLKRVHYAFHSKFVDAILIEFENFIMHLNEKGINKPITSCFHCVDTVTGTFISKDSMLQTNIDASYWTTHCRQPVQFSCGLENLLTFQSKINLSFVFLDIGPGRSCFSFLRDQSYCHENPNKWTYYQLLSSYQNFKHLKETAFDKIEDCTDDYFTMTALGECWKMGVNIHWKALYAYYNELEHPKKVSLPLYPFDHDTIYVLSEVQQLQNEPAKCSSISFQSPAHPDGMCHSNELENRSNVPSTVIDDVIQCFASTFGGCVSSYSLTSDFVALGGDSLSATQFISILNNKFGLHSLPIGNQIQTRTLLTCKNVSKLAALITSFLNESAEIKSPIGSNASAEDRSLPYVSSLSESGMPLFYDSLHVIKEGNLKSNLLPLVLIHPSHGDVTQYQALAIHLHSDQIIMAFRAPSLDGIRMPHSSLVDIGKDYLTTLMHEKSPFMYYYYNYCKNHPNSARIPFLLGGHSFGGLVAYEMACQLRNMTTKLVVSGLLLIDSPAPGKQITAKTLDNADLLDYFLHFSTNASIHRPIADELRERSEREKVNMIELAKSYFPSTFHETSPHALSTFLSIMQIYRSQISSDTLNAAYIGNIIFFLPENVGTHPNSVLRTLHLEWLQFLNNNKSTFVLEHVSGDHVSMIQAPHLVQVSKAVQKWSKILSEHSLFDS